MLNERLVQSLLTQKSLAYKKELVLLVKRQSITSYILSIIACLSKI